jgi:hypothetical protein
MPVPASSTHPIASLHRLGSRVGSVKTHDGKPLPLHACDMRSTQKTCLYPRPFSTPSPDSGSPRPPDFTVGENHANGIYIRWPLRGVEEIVTSQGLLFYISVDINLAFTPPLVLVFVFWQF